MELILAKEDGAEEKRIYDDMDIDLGEDNDFELSVPYSAWDGSCTFGKRIYVPNTEYGGIIRETESITGDREIYARGYTWRGMLQKKILRPESGQDYLTASGELNTIIKSLVEETLPGLFYADTEDTGKGVSGYQFDQYCTLLDGLPTWATSEMMLVVQNLLNFFIPSGSGQAAAIMPIMTPLADLTGVNRQIAVPPFLFHT